MNSISLNAGIRSNLIALQNTSNLIGSTQSRLATGKKINKTDLALILGQKETLIQDLSPKINSTEKESSSLQQERNSTSLMPTANSFHLKKWSNSRVSLKK